MEFVIELRDLASPNWFGKLKSLVDQAGIVDIDLSEIPPPPGAFGAGHNKKFAVILTTVAQLATILNCAAKMYDEFHAIHVPPNPPALVAPENTGHTKSEHTKSGLTKSGLTKSGLTLIFDRVKRVEVAAPSQADPSAFTFKIDTVEELLKRSRNEPHTIEVMRHRAT
jgi:hypothetical protein